MCWPAQILTSSHICGMSARDAIVCVFACVCAYVCVSVCMVVIFFTLLCMLCDRCGLDTAEAGDVYYLKVSGSPGTFSIINRSRSPLSLDQPLSLIIANVDTWPFRFTIPKDSATFQLEIQSNTTDLSYTIAPLGSACNLNIFAGNT